MPGQGSHSHFGQLMRGKHHVLYHGLFLTEQQGSVYLLGEIVRRSLTRKNRCDGGVAQQDVARLEVEIVCLIFSSVWFSGLSGLSGDRPIRETR